MLGFGLEALFLLGVGFTKDTTTAILCLTIAVGFSGFAISGKSITEMHNNKCLMVQMIVRVLERLLHSH